MLLDLLPPSHIVFCRSLFTILSPNLSFYWWLATHPHTYVHYLKSVIKTVVCFSGFLFLTLFASFLLTCGSWLLGWHQINTCYCKQKKRRSMISILLFFLPEHVLQKWQQKFAFLQFVKKVDMFNLTILRFVPITCGIYFFSLLMQVNWKTR